MTSLQNEERDRRSLRISLVGEKFRNENLHNLISSLRQSLQFLITENENEKPQSSDVIFDVTGEDCDKMMDALNQEKNALWHEEVKYLSRSWIKAIMSQPYRKNKKIRRPFDYAKKKIVDYLDWRAKHNITKEINHYLSLEDGKEFTKVYLQGGHCLYWYGVDKDGCPNLWYRAELTDFDKIDVKTQPQSIALIMQAAIDKMPAEIYNFNVIAVFDNFNLFKAMKKPSLTPNFVRTFMKVSPDRLKSAYFISGGAGGLFYDVAAKVAPASIMNKTTKCKSREEAAERLKRDGVISSDEVPTFMGGEHNQDESITQNYYRMMSKVEEDMRGKVKPVPCGNSKAFICRGDF